MDVSNYELPESVFLVFPTISILLCCRINMHLAHKPFPLEIVYEQISQWQMYLQKEI